MSVPNRDKPAFPPNGGWRDNDSRARGLSKREHIAAMAMQGELAASAGGGAPDPSAVAEYAVKCADALIEALENAS